MSNIGSKLDDMLTRFGLLLAETLLWLKTYQEIGSNVEKINEAKVGSAFGAYQRGAFGMLAIELYNIFDNQKHSETISIVHILNELQIGTYTLLHPQSYLIELQKLGIKLSFIDNEQLKLEAIQRLLGERPHFKKDQSLQYVKDARNNFIAHKNVEAFRKAQKASLPPGIDIERLINWADDFQQAIYAGYFPDVVPENIYEWSDSQAASLKRLIKRIVGEENYYSPEDVLS